MLTKIIPSIICKILGHKYSIYHIDSCSNAPEGIGSCIRCKPVTVENSPHDYTEDFTHENGNYQNTCYLCKVVFIGHKRRTICKECLKK